MRCGLSANFFVFLAVTLYVIMIVIVVFFGLAASLPRNRNKLTSLHVMQQNDNVVYTCSNFTGMTR